MGNLCSRTSATDDEELDVGEFVTAVPQQQSVNESDKEDKPQPTREQMIKYSIHMNKSNEDVLVKPDDPAGNQFCVEDCTDCNFVLARGTDSVNVDACEGCNFFFGPINGPIFIRECKDCTLVVSGGQIRFKKCENVRICLHSTTRPIIEMCKNVSFQCFSGSVYNEFDEQFKEINRDPLHNMWSSVYNFTPDYIDSLIYDQSRSSPLSSDCLALLATLTPLRGREHTPFIPHTQGHCVAMKSTFSMVALPATAERLTTVRDMSCSEHLHRILVIDELPDEVKQMLLDKEPLLDALIDHSFVFVVCSSDLAGSVASYNSFGIVAADVSSISGELFERIEKLEKTGEM
ncbi:hypothetical protein PCE1_003584 [Barthelona sp. PCE]